ncbi:hypothetical protein ISS85_02100 [Candidatus Microgenomates bacterium]|nr:hypothetical protein [Candidatus Microgenomates bacterium]
MDRVVLQVPMPKALREQAALVASDLGFSSLQEIVRIILNKIARRELSLKITEDEVIKLSPKAEKRYAKMDEDFRTGKNVFTAKNVDELMKQLKSA